MNNSTPCAASVQPLSSTSAPERIYIATSGQDLVETGLTLDWIAASVEERCRETGEDIALWMIQLDTHPVIVAAFRPAPRGGVSVRWL